MGQGGSKTTDRVLAELPEDERYFGFENFGNTCYCNSVLQALYFCSPFRQRVLSHSASLAASSPTTDDETILSCLAELFSQVAAQRRKSGYLSPRKFVSKVKTEDERFSSFMHQDAHEFFNYLLNDVSETLARDLKRHNQQRQNSQQHNAVTHTWPSASPSKLHSRTPSLQTLHQAQRAAEGTIAATSIRTWVDELFQGRLVSETQCLQCESVSTREEPFYDLSLEIEQNCSVTACLRQFSSKETLDGSDKFSCDQCSCKQEAQRHLRVAALPPILCLHLKRFKYVESLGQMRKLTHRVVFPFSLKLPNTTADCPDADAEYELFAVVVHMGAHVNHGHYVALVRSSGRWLCFDDEAVHGVSEAQVQSTFGSTQEPTMKPNGQGPTHVDHAYILLYERKENGPSGGVENDTSRRGEGGGGRAMAAAAEAMDTS
jgi:ubiquitin carboxyl-terminal hydrolase 12/46